MVELFLITVIAISAIALMTTGRREHYHHHHHHYKRRKPTVKTKRATKVY